MEHLITPVGRAWGFRFQSTVIYQVFRETDLPREGPVLHKQRWETDKGTHLASFLLSYTFRMFSIYTHLFWIVSFCQKTNETRAVLIWDPPVQTCSEAKIRDQAWFPEKELGEALQRLLLPPGGQSGQFQAPAAGRCLLQWPLLTPQWALWGPRGNFSSVTWERRSYGFFLLFLTLLSCYIRKYIYF